MNFKSINLYLLTLPIFLISFLIGIPQTINKWLYKDIFYKYFDYGEAKWYYDLAFLILLFSVYFYVKKIENILNNKLLIFFATIFYVLILNFRYSYDEYLTPFYFNSCDNLFKYFDFLIILPIVIWISVYIDKEKSNNDFPFTTNFDDDVLNTNEKVDYFLKTIKQDLKFYGIVGKWGVGKSYFLDLLKEKLKKENKYNIIIEFDPWRFNSSQLMIQDFSNKIENELVLKNIIKKNDYKIFTANFIKNVNTIKLPFIEFATSFINKPASDEQFEKINSAIKNSRFQFYILIDDLDRLQKEEIFNVLMFLRNVFNFEKLIFIAAYDKDYLVNSLANLNIPYSRSYLEKIFESEFFLHPLSMDERIYFLRQNLLSKFNDTNLKIKIKKVVSYEYYELFFNGEIFYPFRVYRNIINFVNVFESSYLNLKNEVDFESLFYLIILKYFYTEVYDNIYLNHDIYFNLNTNDVIKFKTDMYGERINNEDKSNFQKYLEKLQITDDDKNCINSIINKLFKQTHQKSIYSIALSNNFNKYFTGIISNTLIKNEDFLKIINNDKSIEDLDKVLYPSFISTFKKNHFTENQKKNSINILFFLVKTNPEYHNYEGLFDHIKYKNKDLEKLFIYRIFEEIKSSDINYVIKVLNILAEINLENKNQFLENIKKELHRIIEQKLIIDIKNVLEIINIYNLFTLNLTDNDKFNLKLILMDIYKANSFVFVKNIIEKKQNNTLFYFKIYDSYGSIFYSIFDNNLIHLKTFLEKLNDDDASEIIKFITKLNINDYVESDFSEAFIKKYFSHEI